MKNKKLWIGIGIVVAICIIMLGVYKESSKTTYSKEIRVGVLSFLTGTYAQMGNDILNGAKMAKDVFLISNTNAIVTLISEDGKGESKTAVSAFNRLILSKPDVLLVAGANQVPVVAPTAIKLGIPMMATVIPNSDFLSYNKDVTLLFRNFASSAEMARKIARFAIDKNIETVSCIMIRAVVGEESLSAFSNEFEKAGGKILVNDSFDETSTSIKGTAIKAISEKPDAIYVVGYGSSYAMLLNEIKDMGYKGFILTNDAVASPETLDVLKDKSHIFYADLDLSIRSEYNYILEQYNEKYGVDMSPFAIYGYESFMIIAEAAYEAKNKNSHIEEILLRDSGFDSLTGKIKFRKNGDCELPVTIKEMR